MSAQEEMLHSLVHNISLEFTNFSQKNQKEARAKKGKKGPSETSFLEKRIGQVY